MPSVVMPAKARNSADDPMEPLDELEQLSDNDEDADEQRMKEDKDELFDEEMDEEDARFVDKEMRSNF